MIILKELRYTTIHGVSVYVPFHARVTVIGGDSSSGKSFIKSTVRKVYNTRGKGIVVVYDYESPIDLDMLKALKNRLVIMDNVDLLLPKIEGLREYINKDFDNQYLFFMREDHGINANVNNYAELFTKGKLGYGVTLEAVYLYR